MEPATGLAIGDLAREFQVSTRAIRFYEARGLISPERKGTARHFGPSHRLRLAQILRAKNLGFTLEEIADFLALYDAPEAADDHIIMLKSRADRLIALLLAKRADLAATLAELRRIRAMLAARAARLKSGS